MRGDSQSAAGKRIAPVDPVILRVYNNEHKGATAFFRNRPFIEAFFSALLSASEGPVKILVHACSLGAEPYSLAMWWLHKALPSYANKTDLEIVASDIDPDFLEFAKQGSYPGNISAGMTSQEQSWFERNGEYFQVPDKVRRLVRFLPPMNFVTDDPGEKFDAVLVMNALTYVSAEDQSAALNRCARYCRHLLGVTAFHPDSIRHDLEGVNFEPYVDRHRNIHEAWGDRLVPGPVPPDSPNYTWQLPPYETSSPDFTYRYGALFTRAAKD